MAIYIVTVTQKDRTVFSQEIVLDATRPFADDVREAIETFRMNFPGINLLDDDVSLSISRKPDA